MVEPGCGGSGGGPHGAGGGVGGGAGGGGDMAEAEVAFALDSENAGSLLVESLVLVVDEIRLRSDRGIELDPIVSGVGPIELTAATLVAFASAPPATYSRVEVVLDDPDGAAITSRLSLDGQPVEIAIAGPIALDLTCEAPVPTEPDDMLAVELELDAESLAALLAEATLPPTQGGVVIVDESTAPDLVSEIVSWLATGWSVSCETADLPVESSESALE